MYDTEVFQQILGLQAPWMVADVKLDLEAGQTGLAQRPLAESQIVTRHFTSFQQAAEEAGISRIYGGIHHDFDNTEGLASGNRIGEYVSAHWLRPIDGT